MSILAIFAVLAGSLIINLILNLSKISETLAEKHSALQVPESTTSKRTIWIMVGLFPLLFALLYFGNMASSAKKMARLVDAASKAVESNRQDIEKIGSYRFDLEYIHSTQSILSRITKEEKFFPSATIVVPDQIDNHPTFLEFESWHYQDKDKVPTKLEFIRKCSPEERDYLNSVFSGWNKNHRFSAHKGTYELFYPVKTSRGTIVLFLSEHSNYGKIGS